MSQSLKNKLTDAKIKALKPKEKDYRILDSERLYIEVRKSGVKVWRFKFVLNGKESSMSFGEYPYIALADARRFRDEAKIQLANGLSPVDVRKKEKQELVNASNNTFKSVAEEYVEKRLINNTEEYRNQFLESLKRDVYPCIGNKDINSITSADVLLIMNNTCDRVKKESKGRFTGEYSSIQNRTFIGAVIRYAITTLRSENDPTYAVRDAIKRPEVKHARLLTKEERKRARVTLSKYNGTETVKNAGFILLYSMLRAVEIRRMRWEWVDFDDRTISFPKSAMKKKRIHIVPMSNQVFNVLKKQYDISYDNELVFPSIQKNTKNNGMLAKETLNSMLVYIGLAGVTTHDFRATASTLLYEKGYEEDWIEKQLAHAESNKTKASYDHSRHLKKRRTMLQDWADIVDSWSNLQ